MIALTAGDIIFDVLIAVFVVWFIVHVSVREYRTWKGRRFGQPRGFEVKTESKEQRD